MINPNEVYERLVTLGDEWSDANCAADLLEETKKTLMAQLFIQSKQSSVAAKEMEALQSKPYIEHIKAMVDARRRANRAKVKYDSARVYSELLRTQAANERATMREAV